MQYQEIYWKSEILTNFLVPQFSWQLSRNHDLLKRNICQVSGKADRDKKFEWGSLFKRSCPKWHLYFEVSICSKNPSGSTIKSKKFLFASQTIILKEPTKFRTIYFLDKSYWKTNKSGDSLFDLFCISLQLPTKQTLFVCKNSNKLRARAVSTMSHTISTPVFCHFVFHHIEIETL